jgi:hypothetical protein
MNFLMHGGVVTGIFDNLNSYARPSEISIYMKKIKYTGFVTMINCTISM